MHPGSDDMEDYYEGVVFLHNGEEMPDWLDERDSIHAIMGNGDSVYGEAGVFSWQCPEDPVKAFKVTRFVAFRTRH